ncbi:hypothetical protein P5673_019483 [Acropora cervicornis]|uniref:Uncharacterized protein n=1 Tax=Acropora cervicornis TaxID=6130 RepID=A0AAD9QBM2_ACRCE|nr:hypothetical protein P5673_019483 [Acropora cervicornis]
MENPMIVCFLLFTVMFVGFLTAMPTENVLPAEQNFDEVENDGMTLFTRGRNRGGIVLLSMRIR